MIFGKLFGPDSLPATATAIRSALGYTPANAANVKTMQFLLTGINLNQAATDVGTFTGLPAKYVVRSLMAFDASTSLTLATVDLRTATGGAGTALVSVFALTALTAAVKYVMCTLAAAVGTDYQTAATLTIRNVTAQGAPATASFLLEIAVLS